MKCLSSLQIDKALEHPKPVVVDQLPEQTAKKAIIHLVCGLCTLLGVKLRGDDGSERNVDSSKYRLLITGKQKYVEINLEDSRPGDFAGDYFAITRIDDGSEDLKLPRLETSLKPGAHFDATVQYDCNECILTDVMYNGESVLASGQVTIELVGKQVNFNFSSFDDKNACVYMGIFKAGEKYTKRELAVIENVQFPRKRAQIPAPAEGEQYEQQIPFSCEGECSVQKITVNGLLLNHALNQEKQLNQTLNQETNISISISVSILGVPLRSSASVSHTPTYSVNNSVICIHFPFFSPLSAGIFLATFSTPHGPCTKNVLEIITSASKPAAVTGTTRISSSDISESTESLEESTSSSIASLSTSGDEAATS